MQLLVFECRAAGYPPENRIPMDPRLQSIPEACRRNLMQILTEDVRVYRSNVRSRWFFVLVCIVGFHIMFPFTSSEMQRRWKMP